MIIPNLRDLSKDERVRLLRLLREKARRQAQDDPIGAIRASLFPAQRALFDDPSRYKAGVCSRRAGKSREASAELFVGALSHPHSWALYLALTRGSAKEIMWDVLQQQSDEFALGVRWNETELTGRLPNGSYVKLVGADHKRVIETLRGPRRSKVIIDECGSFSGRIRTLVEDAIEPSLADLRGQIILLGTPPPVMAGYFWEMTQRDGTFSTHHWTLRDNPYMGNGIEEWLADLRKKRGWTEDHPTYRREYLGEWCEDPESLVYKFRLSRDVIPPEQFPKQNWCYVVGMDLGWHDATAFIVLAYSPKHPIAYVVAAEKFRGWTVSRIAQHLEGIMQCFRPERIIADTGGLGKMICEELMARWHFPIKAAEKTEKNAHIELVNSDLVGERLKILNSCKALVDELQVLQWDENGKEMAGQENHLADSLIYSHRYCYHYWHEEPAPKPEPGSDAWAQAEERAMLESVVSQYHESKQEKPDGQLAWPDFHS